MERFIFQEDALLQNTAKELHFVGREPLGRPIGDNRAEVRPEIKMVAVASGQTMSLQPVSKRAFP